MVTKSSLECTHTKFEFLLSEKECVKMGGHCYRPYTEYNLNNYLDVVEPPIHVWIRFCRHCGHRIEGRSSLPVIWEARR
jgi:hypothetical protein